MAVTKNLIQRRDASEVLTTLTADGLSYVVNDPDGTPADGVITHQNKATGLLALVSTAVGRAVLQAADAVAQRVALGLGSAALTTYETGTWTPVIQGSTTAGVNAYSNQGGIYIKQGRLVTVIGRISLSALGTAGNAMAGNVNISGLPFAISQAVIGTTSIGFAPSTTSSSGDTYYLQTATGTVFLLGRQNVVSGVTSIGSVSVADLTNTSHMRFTVQYFAAS